MRLLSIAFAAVLLIGLVSLPRSAQAAPSGTYRETCRNLRVDGAILYAECQAGWGWRSSRLDYKRCYGDIANENGYLVCRGGRRDYDNDGDDYDNDWRGGDGRYDNDWDRGGWNDRGRYGGGLVLYGGPGFSGPSMPIYRDVWNLDGTRFNDRAQSVRIDRGVWMLCEHANFGGRCVTLGRSEPNLWRLGIGGQISSVRRIR